MRKKPVESKAEMVREQLRQQAAQKNGAPSESVKFSEEGESGELSGGIRKRIVTLDDALEAGGVDQSIWRVKCYEITKWEMGYKNSEKQAKVIPLWRIKVQLERLVKKCYSDSLPLLLSALKKLPRIKSKPRPTGKRLLVPCLFDAHLGKYAWGLETGTDQDTEIQRTVFANAMSDILDVAGGGFERVLFPIGNDFFQVNNWLNTTAAGTPVDHDGRFPKVFVAGCEEIINAVNLLLNVAPVDLVWVPGNHDPATSYALAVAIMYRFHGDKNVSVDIDPSPRKYYRYGKTLIGLTHGNEERTQDLPTLMAQECAQHWSETDTREWLTGHTHRKRGYTTKDSEEKMGVRMRTVPALSGTDSWHHTKGYVGCHRAAEAYVYDRDDGYAGHWSVKART